MWPRKAIAAALLAADHGVVLAHRRADVLESDRRFNHLDPVLLAEAIGERSGAH